MKAQATSNGEPAGPLEDPALVLIASPVESRRKHWSHAVRGKYQSIEVTERAALEQTLSQLRPAFLLLDLSRKSFVEGKSLWHLQQLSPSTRIVALSAACDEETELAFLLAGARACCRVESSAALLRKAVAAVRDGEIWAHRRVWGVMIDRVRSTLQASPTVDTAVDYSRLLSLLTPRQREIVWLVGGGGSNKEIAGRLKVSEKTVKAHLTLAFQKLKVSDRLRLALLVNGHTGSSYVPLPLTQLTKDPKKLSYWMLRNP